MEQLFKLQNGFVHVSKDGKAEKYDEDKKPNVGKECAMRDFSRCYRLTNGDQIVKVGSKSKPGNPFAPCPSCCNSVIGTCNGDPCHCKYAFDNNVDGHACACRAPPVQLVRLHQNKLLCMPCDAPKCYSVQSSNAEPNVGDDWEEVWLAPKTEAAWIVRNDDRGLLAKMREQIPETREKAWKIAMEATRTMLCVVAHDTTLSNVLRAFYKGYGQVDRLYKKEANVVVRPNNERQRTLVAQRANLAAPWATLTRPLRRIARLGR